MIVSMEATQPTEEPLASKQGETNTMDTAEQTYENDDDALVAESEESHPLNEATAQDEINTSNEAQANDLEGKVNILNEAERLYDDDKLLEAARLLSNVDQKHLEEKHKEILMKAKGPLFKIQCNLSPQYLLLILLTLHISWRSFGGRPQNKPRR